MKDRTPQTRKAIPKKSMELWMPQTPRRYWDRGAIYTEARPKPETTKPAIKPVF